MCSIKSSVVIIFLVVVPSIMANAIGCRLACKKCRERQEHPSIVTVYCEMCQECKMKRNLRMRGEPRFITAAPVNEVVIVDDPADCPGAPPCSEEITTKEQITLTTTTTTTTTTASTTRKPCPTAPRCVLRPSPCPIPPPVPMPMFAPPPCVQSMPVCQQPCPPMVMQPIYMPGAPSSPGSPPDDGTTPPSSATTKQTKTGAITPPTKFTAEAMDAENYLSVFVGIPKELQGDIEAVDDLV